MREQFEWWILPMVNPDGVVIGNYRCNLQGKDMNRHFFYDNENVNDLRCAEVELLTTYMQENLPSKDSLKMFLDIHAHSRDKGISMYAPRPLDTASIERIQRFSLLLDQMGSGLFSLQNCSINNAVSKKCCARLGINNNYKLANSYTIETSCWGFETK